MKRDSDKLEQMRHSLAHLLAMAALERDPKVKLAIGPATDEGFYYDFEFSEGKAPSQEDLSSLEARIQELIDEKLEFKGSEVSAEKAREIFSAQGGSSSGGNDQPYKLDLIDEITKRGEKLTLYQSGTFVDLCRGGHVKNAKDIDPDAFILDRIAGAYWRGSEKNKMLTRIYGLAFENKKELDEYLAKRKEAEKRDHRKIGRELDLFTISELVGSGLPLFTPKGTILRDQVNAYSQGLRAKHGFQKVWTPHIAKTELYKTSGHWDKFGNELFLVKSQETEDEFVLKPMNCPHHTQIYASRPRSYRDLPIRLMETTTDYRDEKKGELSGLSRVRSLTQDDSHIFCSPEHIEEEYETIMEMVTEFYRTMGMGFRARLSFRDKKHPEKYLGEDALWEKAEDLLEKIAKRSHFEHFVAEGEAAFYGPKIDFLATDALGREHQLATAQLDFVQPSRFGLTYIDTDGKEKTPVMTHLAIAGSLERFLSVYIEHTGGAFPLWLSPVQIKVLPIAEAHKPYAAELFHALRDDGLRAELDQNDETLGKKIRNAKLEKVPYFLVIGDKEVAGRVATLESRDEGNVGPLPLSDVIERLKEEIKERK